MSVFGAGTAVDTSKTTAVFDFAAQVTNQSTASSHVTQYSSLIGQAGKYWKVGGIGCEFFRRCETPVSISMLTSTLSEVVAFLWSITLKEGWSIFLQREMLL